MKKLTLISILTASILIAQENIENIKLKGIEYYKSNNYQLAIEEFLKINDYKQSTTIDFYLARSYYEIGKFENALAIYERILINEPENKRVKLEIAQTYLMLDSLDIAKVSFQELLDDSSIPTVVKNNIEDRLKYIDEKTKKHFFASTLMFGWGYDNNINNSTSIDSFNINISNLGLINIPSDDKVRSTFYETAAIFNHIYKFDENISFKNALVFYKQDFTKDNSKQLDVISFNTTPIYKDRDISYGLIFGLDNVLYGNNHYLNNYSLTPKISYLIDSTKIYETSFKFLNKKFAEQIDEGNNSLVYEYQNKLILQTNDFGIFDTSLSIGKENKEEDIRYDVSKAYKIIAIGNSYRLSDQFTINSTISFSDVKYEDINPLFNTKREDDIYNFILNLGYIYSNDLAFGLSNSFTNQNSNYVPNDYNKNVVKTSMYYTF